MLAYGPDGLDSLATSGKSNLVDKSLPEKQIMVNNNVVPRKYDSGVSSQRMSAGIDQFAPNPQSPQWGDNRGVNEKGHLYIEDELTGNIEILRCASRS
jgi:hypothetical protein